jgi:hypothetical protein
VEITTGRGIVQVSEVSRGGNPVRTARFMAGRVIALVEHPADQRPPDPAARPPDPAARAPAGPAPPDLAGGP